MKNLSSFEKSVLSKTTLDPIDFQSLDTFYFLPPQNIFCVPQNKDTGLEQDEGE